MTTNRRRWCFAALTVLLLLALDTAAWRLATDRLRAAYVLRQTALPSTGWQITSAPPRATGWPWVANLRVSRFRLASLAAPATPAPAWLAPAWPALAWPALAWTADTLTLSVSPFHPNRLTIRTAGAQTISMPGWPTLHLDGAMRADIPLAGPLRSAHLSATTLTVKTPAGPLAIGATTLDAAWQPSGATLTFSAGPANLPANTRWGLDTTLTSTTLSLIAHGPWPRAATPAAAARQWQSYGGTIDIPRLALHWGSLDLSAHGQAALDPDLQPTAALQITLANPQAALTTLAATGAITRGTATAVSAVLTLLSLPARLSGRNDALELPVKLTDGRVSLGQIPLAHLPPLRWSRP